MRSLSVFFTIILIGTIFMAVSIVQAEQKGEPFSGRTNPSEYKESKNCHNGAGSIYYMELLCIYY